MVYFEREIDSVLDTWRLSTGRKPLLLRGARQVGKTSAVRHLGESFEHYAEIDFNEQRLLHTVFESDMSPDQICSQLSLLLGVPIIEGRTLLFLDEIQACPAAINKLRYFYEKMPALHVIAAGSLLEFALGDLPSFGVGRIRSLFMYSFSFYEFLCAIGHRMLAAAIRSASPTTPLSVAVHERALQLLRVFLTLGGMPECVSKYSERHDMLDCQGILDDLMLSYYDDFRKYGSRLSPSLLKEVLTSVALQGQGKFVYSRVGSDIKTPQVKQALQMLSMAGLIYPVVHTDGNGLPLYAESDERYKRYIFMDTGLLQRVLGLNLADVLTGNDLKTVNRGGMAETYVGTELVKNASPYTRDSLYCWHREKRDSNAEVDYVVSRGGEIYPIEVKAGTRGSMQSLRLFLAAKHLSKGIRTSLENFSNYDDIIVYPLYAIGNLVRVEDA